MRKAGKITAGARSVARAAIADGLTTKQIDKAVNEFIVKSRAIPTFKGYGGFPASTCISINEEVIHGIPGKRVIRNGDIVSVDVGATFGGYVGDCAGTYPCGEISDEAKRLIEVTRQSFFKGLKAEFNKIVWPDQETVGKQTIVVIVVTAVLGIFIASFLFGGIL